MVKTFCMGGELNENGNFKEGELVMHGYSLCGGRSDLNENGNFNERKLVMHGYKILYGGELNENGIF